MKRLICSLFLITMVISLAAAPSLDVTSGALHNITALNREGRLTLSMHISGSVKDFADTYLLADSSTNTVW
ncbi:MAG: hypothetical protein SVK54_05520, partial [candidate division WOR-3 bacterium]|nr:hypothetical protein [candidate division WOR-3 bacterium]